MGVWSLYFLAKLGLYYGRLIDLHWIANFALAVALAWPLPQPRARLLRNALAVPFALLLLYYDSHLPAWPQLLDDAAALSNFRIGYLLELARRAVSLRWVAAFAALVLAYALLRRRLRFATFAFIGLAAAAIFPPPPLTPAPPDASAFVRTGEQTDPDAELSPAQLDAALEAFYGAQHGLTVRMARAGNASFDLVLLSVCSLSDDDLDYTHMREASFLKRFDIFFRRFNTAATYSGPALLRLLHGTCGQTAQPELYSGTASDACYLFRSLATAGYRPALLLNHDGQFDHFAEQLRMQGGLGIDPEDNRGAPIAMTSFDGSPLRADGELLARWWAKHEHDKGHKALLYNTISLHDGNRVPGLAAANSIESYAPRLRRLFADLERFTDLVQASGRPTAIVLIPEHGAALRADNLQIAGIREIPTPAITTVPVAVKLVGFPSLTGASGLPLVVDQPSSYFALTALIAGLMQLGPQRATPSSVQALVHELPPTLWVAENNGTVLFRRGSRSYLRSPRGEWTTLESLANP